MTAEGTGRSEFAQLVTYHILGDIYRNMLSAVMNSKCVTYKFREDCRASGPSLQNSLLALFVHFLNSFEQHRLNKRSFFRTSTHKSSSFLSALLAVSASYDELIGRLVGLSGLITERRLTPRGNRAGTTNGGFTLTTTVRVVIRVHNRTADGRADTHVSLTTRLTDLDVLMVDVADLADGGHAGLGYVSQLAGGQSKKCVAVFLRHELSHVTGGSGELSAAAGIKLYVMNKGTGGDVLERKGVTGLDIRGLAGYNLVAYLQTLRRGDVRLFAVLILDQRDERGAVSGATLESPE